MTGDDEADSSEESTNKLYEEFVTGNKETSDIQTDCNNTNSPQQVSSKGETSVYVNDLYEDPRREHSVSTTNSDLASDFPLTWDSMDMQQQFHENAGNNDEYGLRRVCHPSRDDEQHVNHCLTDIQSISKQNNRLQSEMKESHDSAPGNQHKPKSKSSNKYKHSKLNQEEIKFRENAKYAFERQRLMEYSKLQFMQNNMSNEMALRQQMMHMHNQQLQNSFNLRRPGPWNRDANGNMQIDPRFPNFPHRFPVDITQNRHRNPQIIRSEPSVGLRPPQMQNGQISPNGRPIIDEMRTRQHLVNPSTKNGKSQLYIQGSESVNLMPREILYNKQQTSKVSEHRSGNPLIQPTDVHNPHALAIIQQETMENLHQQFLPGECNTGFSTHVPEHNRFMNFQMGGRMAKPGFKQSNLPPNMSEVMIGKQFSPRNRVFTRFQRETKPNGTEISPSSNSEQVSDLMRPGRAQNLTQSKDSEQTILDISNNCPENLRKTRTENGKNDLPSNDQVMRGIDPRIALAMSAGRIPPHLVASDRSPNFQTFPKETLIGLESTDTRVSKNHNMMYSNMHNNVITPNPPYMHSSLTPITKDYVMDLSSNKSGKKIPKKKYTSAKPNISQDSKMQTRSQPNLCNKSVLLKSSTGTESCESAQKQHTWQLTRKGQGIILPYKNKNTVNVPTNSTAKGQIAWPNIDGSLSPSPFKGVDPNSVLNMEKVHSNTRHRTTFASEPTLNTSNESFETFQYPKVGRCPITIVNESFSSTNNSLSDANSSGHSIIVAESVSDVFTGSSDSSMSQSDEKSNFITKEQFVTYTSVHSYVQDGETVTYYIVEDDQLPDMGSSTNEEHLAVQSIQGQSMDAIQESLMIANIQESDLNPEYFSGSNEVSEQNYQACDQTYVIAQPDVMNNLQECVATNNNSKPKMDEGNGEIFYECIPENGSDKTIKTQSIAQNETNVLSEIENSEDCSVSQEKSMEKEDEVTIRVITSGDGDNLCHINSIQGSNNAMQISDNKTQDHVVMESKQNIANDSLDAAIDKSRQKTTTDRDCNERVFVCMENDQTKQDEIVCPDGICSEVEVHCAINNDDTDQRKVSIIEIECTDKIANNDDCHVDLSTVEVECSDSNEVDNPQCSASTIEVESREQECTQVSLSTVEMECSDNSVIVDSAADVTAIEDNSINGISVDNSVEDRVDNSSSNETPEHEHEVTVDNLPISIGEIDILLLETDIKIGNTSENDEECLIRTDINNENNSNGDMNVPSIDEEMMYIPDEKTSKITEKVIENTESIQETTSTDVYNNSIEKPEKENLSVEHTLPDIDVNINDHPSKSTNDVATMDVDSRNDVKGKLGDETFYDAIDAEDNSLYRTCIDHEGDSDLSCKAESNVCIDTTVPCSSSSQNHHDSDTICLDDKISSDKNLKRSDSSSSNTSANCFEVNILEHLRKTMDIVSQSPPQTVDIIDIAQIKRNLETLTQRIESAPLDTRPLSHSRRVIWDILQLCGSCMILSQVALDRLRSLVGQTVSNHLGFYPDMFIDTLTILFKQANIASTMASNVSDDLFFEPHDNQQVPSTDLCIDTSIIQHNTQIHTHADYNSSRISNNQPSSSQRMPNITLSPNIEQQNSIHSNVLLANDNGNSNDSLPVLEKEGKASDNDETNVNDSNDVNNESKIHSTTEGQHELYLEEVGSEFNKQEDLFKKDSKFEQRGINNKSIKSPLQTKCKKKSKNNYKDGQRYLNFKRRQKLKRMKETKIYPRNQRSTRDMYCRRPPRTACIRNTMPCRRLKQDLYEYGSKEILHGIKVPSSIVLNYEEANRFCCHVVLTRTPISQSKTIVHDQNWPSRKTPKLNNNGNSPNMKNQTNCNGLNRSASDSDLIRSSSNSDMGEVNNTINQPSCSNEKIKTEEIHRECTTIENQTPKPAPCDKILIVESGDMESPQTNVKIIEHEKLSQVSLCNVNGNLSGENGKRKNDICEFSASNMLQLSDKRTISSASKRNNNDSPKLERNNIFSSDLVFKALGERARLLKEGDKKDVISTVCNSSGETNRRSSVDDNKLKEFHKHSASQDGCNKENRQAEKVEVRRHSHTHVRQCPNTERRTKPKLSFEELLSMPDRQNKNKSAIKDSYSSSCHYIPSHSMKGNKDSHGKGVSKTNTDRSSNHLKTTMNKVKDHTGQPSCNDSNNIGVKPKPPTKEVNISKTETIASLIREEAFLKCHDRNFLTGILSSLKEKLGQNGKVPKDDDNQNHFDKDEVKEDTPTKCSSGKTQIKDGKDTSVLTAKTSNMNSNEPSDMFQTNEDSEENICSENSKCSDFSNVESVTKNNLKSGESIHFQQREQNKEPNRPNASGNNEIPNNTGKFEDKRTKSKGSLKRPSSQPDMVSIESPVKKQKSSKYSSVRYCGSKRGSSDKQSSKRHSTYKQLSKRDSVKKHTSKKFSGDHLTLQQISKDINCSKRDSKTKRTSKRDEEHKHILKKGVSTKVQNYSNHRANFSQSKIPFNSKEKNRTDIDEQNGPLESAEQSPELRNIVLDSELVQRVGKPILTSSSEYSSDMSGDFPDGLEAIGPPEGGEWSKLSDLYNVKSLDSSDEDDKDPFSTNYVEDGIFSPLRFCIESGDELPPLRSPVKRRRPSQKVRCLRVDNNTHKEIQNILRDIVPQTPSTYYEDESDDDDARTVTDFSYLEQPPKVTKPKSIKKRWDRISICNNTTPQIYSPQDFFTPVASSTKSQQPKESEVQNIIQDQAVDCEIIPTYRKRGMSCVKECFSVLDTVYNHILSEPFRHEVKSKDVPDYYKIIKRGMCYDIIAHKLRNGIYEKFAEFVDDMKLVFSNCYQYHKIGSEIYQAGEETERFFHQKMMETFPDYVPEFKQSELLTAVKQNDPAFRMEESV